MFPTTKSILGVSLCYHKSGAMKKIFLIVMSAALVVACKKNSSSPKEIYLAKILVNGEPETEFVYNSDGQLIQEKYFDEDPSVVVVDYQYEYQYDNNGNPLEKLGYDMPEHKLTSRYIFTLNGQGLIARNSIWNTSGPDSGKLSFHIDNDYKAGRVIKQTWKDADEEISSYRQLGYAPNGNMRTSETYWVYGGVAEKQWGSTYGPSDSTLPASITNQRAFPVNFYFPYMLSSFIDHYTYEDGNVETEWREIISGRKFNSRGLVTEETITTTHIKPAGADEVRTLKFEYKEF
jgi:hypothetical protein